MAPSRDAVYTSKAPKPPPFLSQAIKDGGRVYCSGQVGMDPQTGKMIQGTIGDRTRQIMQNLAAVLDAADSSMSAVIKVNIFLADMDDFAAVNEVYDTFFAHPKPARTCVAVKSLPLGTDVEIECVAKIVAAKL